MEIKDALFNHDLKLSLRKHHSRKDIVEELRLLADSMSSHKALADKIGITPQYLSDILRGNRLPGKKVCAFLKVEPVLVYKDIKE